MLKKALIIGCGNDQKVDDNLILSHPNQGKLAINLAHQMLELGWAVTLIVSESCSAGQTIEQSVNVIEYVSFKDVMYRSFRHIEDSKPDLIVMASEFGGVTVDTFHGKLAVAGEEMTIKAYPLPRLLPRMRALAGPKSVIVGLKRADPEKSLASQAEQQLQEAMTDLCLVSNNFHAYDHGTEGKDSSITLVSSVSETEVYTGGCSLVASRIAGGLNRYYRSTENLRTNRCYPDFGRDQSLIESATVTVLNLRTKKVVLGLREAGDWNGLYSFPGGKIDPGETPKKAAVRELGEECGIHANPEQLTYDRVYYSYFRNRIFRITNYILIVEEDCACLPRPGEIICDWHKWDNLPVNIGPGALGVLTKILNSL